MVRGTLLVVGVISIAAFCARAPSADIRIGIATPLTGHYAWAGERTRVGADKAVQDLNGCGGEQARVGGRGVRGRPPVFGRRDSSLGGLRESRHRPDFSSGDQPAADRTRSAL